MSAAVGCAITIGYVVGGLAAMLFVGYLIEQAGGPTWAVILGYLMTAVLAVVLYSPARD